MKNLKKKHLIDFYKEQHNSLYCLLNRHHTKHNEKNEHNKQTESSELMGAIELMSGALKILK